ADVERPTNPWMPEPSSGMAREDPGLTARQTEITHDQAAQHPVRHGRPDGARLPADARPSRGEDAASFHAGRARHRVRFRLLPKPALRPFALFHDGGPPPRGDRRL